MVCIMYGGADFINNGSCEYFSKRILIFIFKITAFFSSRHPLVMAELRDSPDPEILAATEATLRGHGYRMFAIRKGCRVSETPRLAPEGPRNYMLAKAGTAEERWLLALAA